MWTENCKPITAGTTYQPHILLPSSASPAGKDLFVHDDYLWCLEDHICFDSVIETALTPGRELPGTAPTKKENQHNLDLLLALI
ncbi:Hypothetical protein GLP15_1735 [Giardia lamblia P15]|uniref:Uncharacterized protein n=1 Tax=Giardia intestinalis (strain P15) TaxID=658858 RepID=E1F7C1_GIAIA|nr:Hypothetical protein GLP15_1735 [Giardia lamblia P15]